MKKSSVRKENNWSHAHMPWGATHLGPTKSELNNWLNEAVQAGLTSTAPFSEPSSCSPLLYCLEVCVSCEDSPKSTDKDLRSIWLFKRRIGVFFWICFSFGFKLGCTIKVQHFALKSISLRSDCSLSMLLSWFDLFQAFLIQFKVARNFWSPTDTWPALHRNGGVSSSVDVDLQAVNDGS